MCVYCYCTKEGEWWGMLDTSFQHHMLNLACRRVSWRDECTNVLQVFELSFMCNRSDTTQKSENNYVKLYSSSCLACPCLVRKDLYRQEHFYQNLQTANAGFNILTGKWGVGNEFVCSVHIAEQHCMPVTDYFTVTVLTPWFMSFLLLGKLGTSWLSQTLSSSLGRGCVSKSLGKHPHIYVFPVTRQTRH